MARVGIINRPRQHENKYLDKCSMKNLSNLIV